MIKGFVFGKFLPFHKGHEAMIVFALQHCDFLTVLICVSDRETISGEIRKEWIDLSFPDNSRIETRLFPYKESELPNSSVSSRDISKIWASAFRQLLPDSTVLVSSEPYGFFVAEYMNITHISFDPDRKIVPISASVIRSNLLNGWNYLPAAVKPYYAIKVVILGTESTGKSTLTKQLAVHYQCNLVSEAGRDLIDDSKQFEFEDLERVAGEHAQRIDQATEGNHPLIIIDTDIHITQSYAQFFFQRKLEVSTKILLSNKASLYLYLGKDAPYVQDGTRLEESTRNELDLSHRDVLDSAGIKYQLIRGNWEQRFKQAVESIDQLLNDNSVEL